MAAPPNIFVTLTGAPPNDSVPPDRIFAAAAMPPPPYHDNDANPPPPGVWQAPPQPPNPAPIAAAGMPGFPGMDYPPYYSPYPTLPGVIPIALPGFYPGYFVGYPMPLPIYPGLQPQPQPLPAPAPPAPPAPPVAGAPPPPPPPPPQAPPYEPPGQRAAPNGAGYTILGSTGMCTIHFINDGSRPCDPHLQPFKHTFNFSVHQTLCSLTIKEFLKLLGCPEERGEGVTVAVELGDDFWVEGGSFVYGEGEGRKLAELGWVEGETVWICVKR